MKALHVAVLCALMCLGTFACTQREECIEKKATGFKTSATATDSEETVNSKDSAGAQSYGLPTGSKVFTPEQVEAVNDMLELQAEVMQSCAELAKCMGEKSGRLYIGAISEEPEPGSVTWRDNTGKRYYYGGSYPVIKRAYCRLSGKDGSTELVSLKKVAPMLDGCNRRRCAGESCEE